MLFCFLFHLFTHKIGENKSASQTAVPSWTQPATYEINPLIKHVKFTSLHTFMALFTVIY